MAPRILAVSHMGYLTDARQKRAYVINPGQERRFTLHCLETRYISGEGASKEAYCPDVLKAEIQVVQDDFGSVGVMDFSSVTTPGLYQIVYAGQRSHPFFIRRDLYLRTAYEAFLYSHIQRCGCAVEGWHGACHLDDGVRDDTGEHVDCSGGWHDAGDLRKLVNHTLWHAIGMLWAKRTWGVRWRQYSDDDILDELRWGNRFYLRIKDPETQIVWSDVGASELDNTWTDSIIGTPDDRMIRTRQSLMLQRKYAWIQAMICGVFKDVDPGYSAICLKASTEAYRAIGRFDGVSGAGTLSVVYGLLADLELFRMTGEDLYLRDARRLADALLARQESALGRAGDGSVGRPGNGPPDPPVTGFFYDDPQRTAVFNDWWQGCMLPFALLGAMELLDDRSETLRESVRAYLDRFVVPLSERNVFGAIPVLFETRQKTHDRYRRLSDNALYRYFLPTMSGMDQPPSFRDFGQGTNTHLLGNAAVLFRCHRVFGVETYRTLGLRLLEWVHGANPLGVCMVTGRSAVTPYPHSRYLGLIHGAIQNGLTGDEDDAPRIGGANYDCEWQTLEYWSPTQAQYLMSICELHPEYSLETDIGVTGQRRWARPQ